MNDLRQACIALLESAPDHIQGHWPELDDVCKALSHSELGWVELTTEEISTVSIEPFYGDPVLPYSFARSISKLLKEKNFGQ